MPADGDQVAWSGRVLLYNVGMAVFAPLIIGGLTCQRGRSPDAYHRVEYRLVAESPQPGGVPYAQIHADLGTRLPSNPGQWWAALHDQVTILTAPANRPPQGLSTAHSSVSKHANL